METKKITSALSALAQESRLSIFKFLVQAGPQGLAAGKIAEMANIAPSSLSFHLKELLHADMVSARQEGRFVIYAADFGTMNAVIRYLTENCCGGNPCTPVNEVCCTPNQTTTQGETP